MSNLLMLKVLGQNPSLVSPYGNYVFVKLIETESETLGGIVLPSQVTEKDRQILGRVIKTGPGQRAHFSGETIPCHSHVGDLVIVQKHAPMEVRLGGEVLHVVFEGDIVGKITPEDEATLNGLVADLQAQVEAEQAALAAEREAAVIPPPVEPDAPMLTERPSGLFVVQSQEG